MKRKKKFKAELQGGHKDDAVEVPFNPAETWGIAAVPLWRGRRGYPVQATINGVSFETSIVPRQQTFYMLVDRETKKQAGVAAGDVVELTVAPNQAEARP